MGMLFDGRRIGERRRTLVRGRMEKWEIDKDLGRI